MVSWKSVLALDFGHAAVAFGVTANATSTVAIWPGTVGSTWGYRRELRDAEPRFRWLIVPSLVGGLTGALLLRWTPPAIFDRMVPFLILFATLLFMVQEPVQRMLKTDGRSGHQSAHWFAGMMLFQLMVGLYGGYFGAGIGILMLASLGLLGFEDVHAMNALKVRLGFLINVVAALYFIISGLVEWPSAGIMAVGTVVGGYAGAQFAQKIPQARVRSLITLIGLVISAVMFYKQFS